MEMDASDYHPSSDYREYCCSDIYYSMIGASDMIVQLLFGYTDQSQSKIISRLHLLC